MAEYVKHTGGSVAGKSKQPYDAMVYKDADSGYTIAVDGNGNVIKKVLSSANTDDVVIQAAIDSVTTGTVYVAYATYTIAVRIDIGENVNLEFDHNTIVQPATDIDMFYVKNGSRISGCKINVRSIVSYSSSCIVVDGVEKLKPAYETNSSVQIENIWFDNNEYTGTAIYFKSTEVVGSGYIYGVVVDKVRIYMFDYGIRLNRTGAPVVNWINGNHFSNIFSSFTRRLIYMESDTPDGRHLDTNMFTTINVQTGGTPDPSIPIIYISGSWNVFKDMMLFDWNVAWGDEVVLDANSKYNYVECNTGGTPYIIDYGTDNFGFYPNIHQIASDLDITGDLKVTRLGIGVTPSYLSHIKGTTATDLPTYSAEFLDADNWTSTDWTGSWAAGWTHPVGTIETISLNDGGTGYTALDVLTVVQVGGSLGTVRVDTVDGSGVIQTCTRIDKGSGYTVANGLATTGGTGTGGKINILTINNTTILSHDHLAVIATKYQIAYTVTGRTAGTFNVTFGGFTRFYLNSTGSWSVYAASTGVLRIIPTETFDGTIVISIKSVTAASTPVCVLTNSAGSVICEQRIGNVNTNVLLGRAAGSFVTTGSNNILFGPEAGYNIMGGYNNIAIGYRSLYGDPFTLYNIAIGNETLYNNLGGTSMVAVGYQAGYNNTIGYNNVYIGYYAGKNTNQKADAVNTICLGANTFTDRSNQIVIGNHSVVETQLRGSVYVGSTSTTAHTQPTARMHLPAGTTGAGTGPLKFNAGPVTTVPEAGLFEFDGSDYFVTIGSDRFKLVLATDINSGTAATITAGNTYVDVTHSLAATPTKVRVTPTTNLGTRSFWVDTKGAATFRININSSDAIDHTFDWEAEV
jgi:hypothetical protein